MRADLFGDQLAALEQELVRLREEPRLEEHAVNLLPEPETAHEELRVADEEARIQHEELERLLHAPRP